MLGLVRVTLPSPDRGPVGGDHDEGADSGRNGNGGGGYVYAQVGGGGDTGGVGGGDINDGGARVTRFADSLDDPDDGAQGPDCLAKQASGA